MTIYIKGGQKVHPISIEEFKKARDRISSRLKPSTLSYSQTLSESVGASVYLKKENEQKTGSFKVRGALNKALNLSEEEAKKGLISCSAGNHAQGVAYAAKSIGSSALLVLPENTPIVKENAVRHYGAQVILHGQVYDESYLYALHLAKESKKTFIHAYQDPMIVAGQGSVAMELIEQEPDLSSVVVPIGGGGLIGGIAGVIKQIKPNCRVYGVVSEMAPGMKYLFHKKTYNPGKHFLASGLADGITVKKPSQEMFDTYISKYVDDVVSVTDDEIASAIVLLLERGKTVVEGSGAVPVAALLKQHKKWDIKGKCALILSGGNIDLNIVSQVIEKGLKSVGRLGRLCLVAKDQPGTLSQVTQILSKMKSNILSVQHERNNPHLSHGLAEIQLLIETRGEKHLEQVREALKQSSYKIKE